MYQFLRKFFYNLEYKKKTRKNTFHTDSCQEENYIFVISVLEEIILIRDD